MEIEIYHGHFSVITDNSEPFGGTVYVPECYVEPGVDVQETVFGYGVRLTMPGYLDCTEWDVFDTEEEAVAHGESLLND